MKAGKTLKIKVCGMRFEENIKDISHLKPDYMGFIFYAPSSRNAMGLKSQIIKGLPQGIIPVGVFVDSSLEEILETATLYGIKTVQLHGNENPVFCESLKKNGLEIIKAFRIKPGVKDTDILQYIETYVNSVNLFLFDTAGNKAGGNGIKFDWSILKDYKLPVPFFLSGGIGPEDIDTLQKDLPEKCIGIDLNSKFEISPGFKDKEKLSSFINLLK